MKKPMMRLCAAVAAAFVAAAASLSSQADTGPLNGTPDDVRVAPLVTAHWNQGSVGNALCYNYYTPLNRVCGCTATALGQIMYYHRYPTERILPGETLYDSIDGYGSYSVSTNGTGGMTNTSTGEYTAFDPPYGGPYDWSSMVDSPTGSTPENSRKAIGLLTRDAGFAVFSHYFGGSTSGYNDAIASSIILNLHYADAVRTGFNADKLIANLDAGLPIQIGLQQGSSGHAVVADGYGYHNGKLYIHINYGYSGNKDGWYDTTADINGMNISAMVANIFPPARGARHSSVISGRVLDASGNPVANATVTATGATNVTTTSSANGTYAFILPAGNYTFNATSGGNSGTLTSCGVEASSQTTRAEAQSGWGTGVNNSKSGVNVTLGKTATMNEPDAYLEYVQSDGNQYIDTGHYPYANMTIKADIDIISGGDVIGCSNHESFPITINDGCIAGRLLKSGYATTDVPVNSGRKLIVSSGTYNGKLTISVNGEVKAQSSANCSVEYTGKNMYVFAGKDGTACSAKLYGMKIYVNDELVRNFVPAIKDGVAGLYDRQNDKWYSPSGTLTAGPVVSPLEEQFHTDLLGRFAKRAQDFDVGDYVQANLIAHFDGIRNAGADLPHDSTTRTWKNLVAGGPDATFVGDGGEWNAAGNGFVFDGSSVRADMDSPGIDMNHVNSTVQIACDVDYTQQSSGGGWYPGIFVMTDQDYGIFYNNTGSKSNVLNYKPWPYSNNDGGQRPSISPWGGKYVTAAFDGYKQYLVEGTSLGEGKTRSSYSDQVAKRFAWGGNPQGSTRYVKGTYHSVRIYNATLTEDQLAQNRYVDEMRFRGAFMADDVDIVIATNVEGVEGAEPSGEYMVNGSHTFSATDVMLNGKLWTPAGYTLENWNETSGTWTQIAESANTSFAFTNCLANGKMRLTWDFAVVVATPSSPTPTQFSMGQQTAVTLTCATEGATIYYTTDGSDPTTSSTAYSAPFAVTSGTTVKAMAYMDGAQQSGIYTATFTYVPPATLTHRWSFNGTSDAQCLADSVGGVNATKGVSGSVTWDNGTAIVASGGSGNDKGYLEIGGGVLGSGDATLEIWYEKLENPGAWSSAFAYGRDGDNRFQINTAYGYNQEFGGSTGSSRAPVTAKIGGTDRISSTDWNKGCLASLVPNLPQHISITFKRNGDGSTTVRWMSRDCVTGFLMKECSGTIPSWTLADAPDFILTLGRDIGSLYDLKAKFHEVRTWNGVLSDEQLSVNAFAGPDAPVGGRESAFSSGFDIAAGSTFTIGKEGMFRTSGPVGVGTGASIVFDTANFSGTEMKFVSAGFSLPAGASSVLDFVTLTDSDNYVASVDGGTITVVSAQPAYAKWIGASAPTSAADLANAANWTCYGQDGTTVISGAVPGSLTTLLIDGTTSFSLPAGVTPTWGSVLVGGHAAPHYGRIASTGGDNNWITFRQRPITDYTPCGEKAVSYLDRTSGNSPSDLGGSQLRFDGWIYASAEQAGRWDIRCAMDDMITFALDGDWQFLLNTWRYAITAGSYVSEGWHRFTLIVRDTGGGYGVSTGLNGRNYPFVVSINGGAEIGFSQLTFGAGPSTVTLADDCDWSALGEINLANGVVLDLNGHNLKIDDFTTDSFGAMVTNTTGTMSTMIFDKDPFSSSANVQGLLRGVGENITLVQDGARSATWTGGGNDGGDPANPANWEVKLGTLVIANAVPDYNTTVLMQGQNINMQAPYGTTLNCASFQIGNCTFTADCDWRGLSTPSISGEANLNGHNLYLGHLNAVGGSFVNNAADTTSRVLFDVPASGSYSEFSEQVFIDNIGNLSMGENVFLSLLKPDDENDTTTATLMLLGKSANVTAEFVQTNGTVNLGDSVNKFGNSSGHRGVYAMYGGTLTTGGGSEFVIGANGNGTFNLSGGDVTIGNWISVGRFSGGNGTFNMTGGSLTVSRTNRPMWLGGDNGTGVFNFGGTATATFKGIDIGRMNSARGTLNMNGGTLTVSNGDGFNVGRDAVGIVEQNDGTLNVNTIFRLAWGSGGGVSGTYTLNGGTVNVNADAYWGDGRSGTFVQNGGTMNANNGVNLAVGGSSSANLTLAGGVFNTKFFNKGSGTANITFNGGTVAAKENTSTFFRGISSVNVGAGGMTFDTAGYNVEINSLGMTPAVGSSFVKAGSGTLTMDTLPPTDAVVASNGTFKVLAAASSASASADTLISVSSGGTLDITGVSLAPAFVSGAGTVQGGTLTANKELRAKLGDCLTVSGGTFNVEGAKVTFSAGDIASLETTRKTYTLVRAANGGTITGSLLQPDTDAVLPKGWHVTATSSSVTLRKNGFTIRLR